MADRLTTLLAGCLDMHPDSIAEDSGTQNLAQWDSLRHMRIVFALEEEFGIRFRDHELMSLVSLAAIRAALREQKVSFE